MFPQYGVYRWDYGGVTVIPDGDTESIIRVDFKGRTYGGRWLIIDNQHLPDTITVYTYIDDTVIASDSPYGMWQNGFDLGYATPQRMILMDYRRWRYMGSVREGITFRESFEIKVGNASGGNITCTGNLYSAHLV